MIITEEEIGSRYVVIDMLTGYAVSRVKSFNTENKEAEIYVEVRHISDYFLSDKLKEKGFVFTLPMDVDSSLYLKAGEIVKEFKRTGIYDKNRCGHLLPKVKGGIKMSGEIVIAKVTLLGCLVVDINTLEVIK